MLYFTFGTFSQVNDPRRFASNRMEYIKFFSSGTAHKHWSCFNILAPRTSLARAAPDSIVPKVFLVVYCLTACLYAKCCNLIGWIMERGPSIHFRIDDRDRLYGFRLKLKHSIFGEMTEKLSTEVMKN